MLDERTIAEIETEINTGHSVEVKKEKDGVVVVRLARKVIYKSEAEKPKK